MGLWAYGPVADLWSDGVCKVKIARSAVFKGFAAKRSKNLGLLDAVQG
jgi:hypothetical protein